MALEPFTEGLGRLRQTALEAELRNRPPGFHPVIHFVPFLPGKAPQVPRWTGRTLEAMTASWLLSALAFGKPMPSERLSHPPSGHLGPFRPMMLPGGWAPCASRGKQRSWPPTQRGVPWARQFTSLCLGFCKCKVLALHSSVPAAPSGSGSWAGTAPRRLVVPSSACSL